MNTTIPELSDEQIQSMRFAIMNDVDKNVRARTRRYRQVVVGAAAVIALGSIGTSVIQSVSNSGINLSAGGSGDASSTDKNGPSSSRADSGAAEDTAGGATANDAGKGALTGEVAPEDADREIVTTGTIGMTVAKPVDAAGKISAYVSTAGGRVDSRSETASSDDNGGSVHLVVRIPQTKVEDSIETFRTYGTVEFVNVEDYDATTEGKDLDARIKALRVSVDRLSALMSDADSTNELIRAESALTQRQAELDSLVSQRTSLKDRVALSSLEIDLAAKSAASSPSASGFWGGVVDGWNGLVTVFESLIHGFGVILPWLLTLGILGAIALTGRRLIGKD